MYNNKLTSLSGGGALSDLSLLVVLDIHGNEFTNLPSDIMCLVSLKVCIAQILSLLLKVDNKLSHLCIFTNIMFNTFAVCTYKHKYHSNVEKALLIFIINILSFFLNDRHCNLYDISTFYNFKQIFNLIVRIIFIKLKNCLTYL